MSEPTQPVARGGRGFTEANWTPIVLPSRGTLTETLTPWLQANSIAVPSWKPSYRPR